MTSRRSNSWMKPAIRVAAAGFGAAVAGPLGGALGGWLGAAVGGPAADLVEKYAEKFGDNAAEKLLDVGSDSLVERLKESAPDLMSIYRDALRQSLGEVHVEVTEGFDDWFANWDLCLAASMPLDLPPTHPDQLVPEKLDDLFLRALVRLDAQGTAIRQKTLSLELECRAVPEALLSELNNRLPQRLQEDIQAILVKPEYEEGWKQAQLIFQRYVDAALGRIDEATQRIDRKTDVLPRMAEDVASLLKMAESVHRSEIDQYRLAFGEQLQAAATLVGREEVFAMLEQFEATHASGYFSVTAEAGLGKTALAAAVAKRRGAMTFFTSGSRGFTRPDQCLNHLSAEIIARFRLPYQRLPARAGEDSGFFEKVLQEAAEIEKEHVWLVVDALDEADSAVGRNPLFLPKRLPRHVFCLVTQRPSDELLETDPETPVAQSVLMRDSPMQRDDILAFLIREISRPEISSAARMAMPGRDLDSVIAELAQLSEGNFMYLSHLLEDLRTGEWSFGTSGGTTALPSGLRGYYGAIWKRMEAMTKADGPNEWRSLYRPIIGLLAVAREPVLVSWLADLSGCDTEDVQNPVLHRWARFLSRDNDRWRILHRSFADFLNDTLDLRARHTAVCHYYKNPTNWKKHQNYALRHLSTHLRAAGDMTGIFGLVDAPGWYENQLTADPTGMGYELDLRHAWLLAASADSDAAAHGRTSPALAQEIKFAVILSTLADHWANIPPAFLVTLLEIGILSDVQVVGLIEKMHDDSALTRALAAVAPRLSHTLVPRVREIALQLKRDKPGEHRLDAVARAEILIVLADRVSGARRKALLDEALSAARAAGDDDDSKPELLCRASVELLGGARDECLGDARDLASHADDPYTRASRLAPLVVYMPDVLPMLNQALRDARTKTPEETSQGEVLVEIVRAVPAAQRPEIAREAIAVASEILDVEQRAQALTDLIIELPVADRQPTAAIALETVRALPDLVEQANHLLTLSTASVEADRAALVFEAEQLILKMSDRESQARGLLRLSGFLIGPRGKSCLDQALRLLKDYLDVQQQLELLTSEAERLEGVAKEVILETARQLVPTLPDRFAQVRSLIAIGEAWSGKQLRELVLEATTIPEWILAIGKPQNDGIERAQFLAVLLPDLPPSEQDVALNEAKELVNVVSNPYERACILATLLPALESGEIIPVVKELRSFVESTDKDDQRADLLTKLLPYVPVDEQPQLLTEALAAARSIPPGDMYATGTIDMRTGVVTLDPSSEIMGRPALAILRIGIMVDHPQRGELVAEALEAALDLPASMQAGVLEELSSHLSGAQTREVLAAYRRVLCDPLREEFHQWLSERLAVTPTGEGLESDAQRTAVMDAEKSNGGSKGFTVDEQDVGNSVKWDIQAISPFDLFQLSRAPGQAAFGITFDSEAVWEDARHKEEAERSVVRSVAPTLTSTLSAEELRSVFDASVTLREHSWRNIGLLLRRLAATESSQAAFDVARCIWTDQIPPVVAAIMTAVVPLPERRAHVDAALAAAIGLDAAQRATVLSMLLPRVEPMVSAKVVEELAVLTDQMAPHDILELLKLLAMDIDHIPPSASLLFVQRLLRSTGTRRDLFASLRHIVPECKRLAGQSVIRSLPQVVREATERVK